MVTVGLNNYIKENLEINKTTNNKQSLQFQMNANLKENKTILMKKVKTKDKHTKLIVRTYFQYNKINNIA